MAIVPVAQGVLAGAIAAGLEGMYAANNLIQAYQNNREVIQNVVQQAQEISEYIPRPPAGKRLRIQTPPKRVRKSSRWQTGTHGLSHDQGWERGKRLRKAL